MEKTVAHSTHGHLFAGGADWGLSADPFGFFDAGLIAPAEDFGLFPDRAPPTTPPTPDTWTAAVSGNWTDPTKWSAGVVPNGSSTATIAVTGTSYTVTISSSDTASSLYIDSANATVSDNGGLLSLATTLNLAIGTFALSNEGSISASSITVGSLGVLTSDGSSPISASVTSTGLISVSSGGTLDLTGGGSLGGTISGAGTLELNGAGVTFTSTASTLAGNGNLNIDGNATLAVDSTLSTSLALSFGGLSINSTGFLTGDGTLTTSGTTTITPNGPLPVAYVGGSLTWTNTGTVNDSGLVYLGISGTDTESIDNQGSFNLIGDYAQVKLNTNGDPSTFTNTGTLASTGSTQSIFQAFINNTGLISVSSGSWLDLAGGGSLGGTITNAGTLELSGTSSTFTSAGGTLAGTGNLFIDGNATLSITSGTLSTGLSVNFGANTANHEGYLGGPGTLLTSGSTTIYDGGGVPAAVIGEGVTWVNTGTVMDAGLLYFGFGSSDTASIVNQQGASFDLTTDDATLAFNPGNSGVGTFTNAGTLAKTGTGGIGGGGAMSTIHATVLNESTGLIEAASGTLSLSALSTTNLSSAGTLSGGSYEAGMNSVLELSNSGSASITTDSASVTLTGTGSMIEGNGANLDSTLATITASGVLSLLSERNFTTSVGTFTDGGLLSLGGVTFTESHKLSISNSGAASGYGTISGTISDAGTISAIGGSLVLTGTLTGTGKLTAATGATLDLTTGGTLTEHITGNGTLQLDTAAYTLGGTSSISINSLTVDSSLSGTGTISSAVTDVGTITANGGVLKFIGAVSGAGSLAASSSATLDLTAGGALTETISGSGALQLDGTTAYTLSSGTISIANILVDTSSTLSGYGTIASAMTDSGTIAANGGTLFLSGSIGGTTGVLQAATSSVLDILGGGTLGSSIAGSGTVLLASNLIAAASTLTVSATNVTESANLTISSGNTFTESSGDTFILAGGSSALTLGLSGNSCTINNNGIIESTGSGGSNIAGTFTNSGTVILTSGNLSFLDAADTIAGTGTFQIDSTGTLTLAAGTGAGQLINFENMAGTLDLNFGTSLAGTITDFVSGSVIDLLNDSYSSSFSVSYSGSSSSGVLSISEIIHGTFEQIASLNFSGNYTGAVGTFTAANDGHGGTAITFS